MTIAAFAVPIALGANPAIDALFHALHASLEDAVIDLRVVNDITILTPDHDYPSDPIHRAVDAGADAIGFYVVDPAAGEAAVTRARKAGIPVFTIGRPLYPVTASLNFPGFNQGVFMMQHLLSRLDPGARNVGIIGGPNALTDSEQVAGLGYAVKRAKQFTLVNDPEAPRYCNQADNRAGGRAAALRFFADCGVVDGLVPYNDETMLGTLDALEELGIANPPLMVSRNGSPLAVEAVRQGRTAGTWDLDAPAFGQTLAQLFIKHLSGAESYDDYAAMAPAGRMITAENVVRWTPWEQRMRMRPLAIGLAEPLAPK